MSTVSLEDYEHDTRELAERAGAVIADQKHELDRRDRETQILLWAMVRAAGGKLFVPNGYLARGMPKGWRVDRDDAKNGTHFRILED